MICGNFKATDRGFHGEIRFFGLSEKVEILRIGDKASDKSPDYRIVAADAPAKPPPIKAKVT